MVEEFAFKELKVWHKSVDFADKVIGVIDNLNSSRKHFRLLEQIEAASASISSNIAEGKGRFSKKEFRQYLYISRGSLYETISLLNICQRRYWISKKQLEEVETNGLEITKMLKGLINSIEIN
jgi:four helix bundle protein